MRKKRKMKKFAKKEIRKFVIFEIMTFFMIALIFGIVIGKLSHLIIVQMVWPFLCGAYLIFKASSQMDVEAKFESAKFFTFFYFELIGVAINYGSDLVAFLHQKFFASNVISKITGIAKICGIVEVLLVSVVMIIYMWVSFVKELKHSK